MRRFLSLFVFLSVALGVAAQSAPPAPQLTWIRFYQVVPGKEADFLNAVRATPLAADGKVVGWGVTVPLSHTGEPWTHAVYAGLANWAAADALVPFFESIDSRTGAIVVPSGAHDNVIRHVVQSEIPPRAKPKFIVVERHAIKAGRDGDAISLFNEWAKPIFADLTAKGRLSTWGFSTHDTVFSNEDWSYMVWAFVPDLGAIGEVNAATEALDALKLRGYFLRLRDMSDRPFRGEILKIVYSVP